MAYNNLSFIVEKWQEMYVRYQFQKYQYTTPMSSVLIFFDTLIVPLQ